MRRRPDGFHDIETIFQRIDLKDDIAINNLDSGILIECNYPGCPRDKSNLAYQAADILREKTNHSGGCRIEINKRIPIGAGLGGGSSNAATTLKALNKLWDVNLPEKELQQLGQALGSDIPFFIYGGTCLGQGRGEILTPIEMPYDFWGVLICPPISISSGWAYQAGNFSLTKIIKKSKLQGYEKIVPPLDSWKEFFENDLETVVFAVYPELQAIKKKLYHLGAFFSQMSGSGSSIFGLYHTREDAERALAAFSEEVKKFLFRPC